MADGLSQSWLLPAAGGSYEAHDDAHDPHEDPVAMARHSRVRAAIQAVMTHRRRVVMLCLMIMYQEKGGFGGPQGPK